MSRRSLGLSSKGVDRLRTFGRSWISRFALPAKASRSSKSAQWGAAQRVRPWSTRSQRPTFNKTRALWKVFWKRADLKWHAYPPMPHVGTIDKFVELVAEDKHACFFG